MSCFLLRRWLPRSGREVPTGGPGKQAKSDGKRLRRWNGNARRNCCADDRIRSEMPIMQRISSLDRKFQLEGQESKRNLTGNDSDDGTAMRDGIVAQMTGYGAKCR